jgi:hypothetical protein
LARYLDATVLPAAPLHWKSDPLPATFPMFLNNEIGDCAIAAPGHMEEAWSVAAGLPEDAVTDNDVLNAYSAVSGYNPQTKENDNGCNELDVLNYWRKVGIGTTKIGAFAIVDPHTRALVMDAAYLFGGLYIGLDLPASAQEQSDAGQVWHTAGSFTGKYAPGSWGGHAVNVVAYDRYGLTVVTWGALQKLTWGFWSAYCDEAWAIVSSDFFGTTGKAPNGFDLSTLEADLAKVGKVHH